MFIYFFPFFACFTFFRLSTSKIYVDLILWLFSHPFRHHHHHHHDPFAPLHINCGPTAGCAGPNLSQNMFFTGTTTIPLDVMHQNHQSLMTQNRTPPTLFQYPSEWFIPRYYSLVFDANLGWATLAITVLVQLLENSKWFSPRSQTHLRNVTRSQIKRSPAATSPYASIIKSQYNVSQFIRSKPVISLRHDCRETSKYRAAKMPEYRHNKSATVSVTWSAARSHYENWKSLFAQKKKKELFCSPIARKLLICGH